MTRLIVQFWNRWTQLLQYFFARIYWGCVCCCRLKNSLASQCSYTYCRLWAAMASVIDIPHGGHPPPAVTTSADRRGGDRKRNDSISSSADTVISTTSTARYKLPHTEGQIKYLHSVYVLLCILYRWTQEAAYLRYYMKYITQSSIHSIQAYYLAFRSQSNFKIWIPLIFFISLNISWFPGYNVPRKWGNNWVFHVISQTKSDRGIIMLSDLNLSMTSKLGISTFNNEFAGKCRPKK